MNATTTPTRKIIVTGLLVLLTVIGLSPVAEAGTWIRRDWSKVQRIAPGARTRVRLYKDRAPGGIYKIEGRFNSATPEAITLSLPGGKSHTLQKHDVTKVLVYRPLSKRYPGWITLGVSAGISIPTVAKDSYDLVPSGKVALNGLFIGVPTVLAFLVAPKWGGVYNVPHKLRDDAAPEPPPATTKQSSITSDSRLLLLEDKASGPELLRSQGRQAVMRQNLPLDLSTRPIYGAHTD